MRRGDFFRLMEKRLDLQEYVWEAQLVFSLKWSTLIKDFFLYFMVILGIDPGIHLVGYGLIEVKGPEPEILDFGVIRTLAGSPLYERLAMIVGDLEGLCKHYRPTILAIEKLFFAKNTKTALQVAEARGAIIHYLYDYGLEIYEYTPLEVKMAITGYGQAAKEQMQLMVQRILKMSEKPNSDDAADALAVALCYLQRCSFERKVAEASN